MSEQDYVELDLKLGELVIDDVRATKDRSLLNIHDNRHNESASRARRDFVSNSLRSIALELADALSDVPELNADEPPPWRRLLSLRQCLPPLHVTSVRTGFRDHYVLELTAATSTPIPCGCRLRKGDDVKLVAIERDECGRVFSRRGVLTQLSDSQLTVVLYDKSELTACIQYDHQQFTLIRSCSKKTNSSMCDALNALLYSRSLLQRALFGETPLFRSFSSTSVAGDPAPLHFSFVNPNLDDSQRQAVERVLQRPPLVFLHGPPGTGKTTTLVEIIVQHIFAGERVLACAASNTAVDNMLLRVASALGKLRGRKRVLKRDGTLIRLGNELRMSEAVWIHSLDEYTSRSAGAAMERRTQRGVASLQPQRGDPGAMARDVKRQEKQSRHRLLSTARVVFSTLTGAGRYGMLSLLPNKRFDLVIIDECSQAKEAACWIAIPRADRLVLAGDHHQLPPTVVCQNAAVSCLKVSLVERCASLIVPATVILTTQYRMNRVIQQWSSDMFYDGKLQPAASVASHCLTGLEGVSDCPLTRHVTLLIDTCGCDLSESVVVSDGSVEYKSHSNEGEADIVVAHVKALLSAGVSEDSIGVIAPYIRQVSLISQLLTSLNLTDVEVDSVDSFQGREKEAIVLSLVRSNERGDVGFLGEIRRLNVAVTRARRHLAVVCDTDTVCNDEKIATLVEHLREVGHVESAVMYEEHIRPLVIDSRSSTRAVNKPAPKGRSAVHPDKSSTSSRSEISNGPDTARAKSSDVSDISLVASSVVDAPDVSLVPSDIPDTTLASSDVPDTSLLPSDVPDTSLLPSDVPDTPLASSDVPDTSLVLSDVPDTSLLPSDVSDTPLVPSDVPDTSLLPSDVPDTSLVLSDVPDTSLLPSDVPDTSLVPPDVPDTSLLSSDVPDTSLLSSDVPDTSLVPSDVPDTSLLPSDVFDTSLLPSDVPDTPLVPSDVPGTYLLPSDVPDTSLLPSDVPDTPLVPSDVPDTSLLPSDVPDTSLLSSDVPDAPDVFLVPSDVPDTSLLPSDVPDTSLVLSDVPDTPLVSFSDLSNKTLSGKREDGRRHGQNQGKHCPSADNSPARCQSKTGKSGRKHGDRRVVQREEDEIAAVCLSTVSDKQCFVSASPGSWGVCSQPSSHLLLQQCSHCQRRFCLRHHQAELHGCGPAAKQHAQNQFRTASTQPNSLQRQKLQHRVHTLIDTSRRTRSRHT